MGNFGEKHLWSKEFKPEAVIVEKVCKLTRRILLLVGKPFNQNWPGVERIFLLADVSCIIATRIEIVSDLNCQGFQVSSTLSILV